MFRYGVRNLTGQMNNSAMFRQMEVRQKMIGSMKRFSGTSSSTKTVPQSLAPLIVLGISSFGVYKLWNRTRNGHILQKFYVSCDATLPLFKQKHVFGKFVNEVLQMDEDELDQLLRVALGSEYGSRAFNSCILSDWDTLEKRMKLEMDAYPDSGGSRGREEQWEKHRVAGLKPGASQSLPRQATFHYWLPGTYPVLQCYHQYGRYVFSIGHGYSILVALKDETDEKGVKRRRPIHLAGVSIKRYSSENLSSPLSQTQTFEVDNSVMDLINSTLQGMKPFCPPPKSTTPKSVQPKPSPVQQHHSSPVKK